MDKKIELKDAKCTKLSFDSAVEFLRQEKTITGFDIDAYTGAIVDRWWGKLAIAVEGITAKQQMPIFRDHDRTQIVGHTTKTTSDGSFKVSGLFSKSTKAAQEVLGLAAEGFPWQASIGVKPKMVLEIMEGSSMLVNGQNVSGPAEVWLESEVYETSFVPLGADSETRVTVFEVEEPAMAGKRAMVPEKQEKVSIMDLEKLKKDHPDLVQAIATEALAGMDEKLAQAKKEGATAERDRIQSVRNQTVAGHEALIESLAFDGVTTGPEAAVKVIAAVKSEQKTAAENFKADANNAVKQPSTDDNAGKTDDEKLKAEWDKNADLRAEFAQDFEVFKAYRTDNPGIRVKHLTK